MRDSIRLWFATVLGVMLPASVWNAYEAFILHICDPKFGCSSGFQFGLFILSLCAFLSAGSVVISSLLLKKYICVVANKVTIIMTVIAGSGLGYLSQFLLSSFDSVGSMVFGWLLISFIVGLSILWKVFKGQALFRNNMDGSLKNHPIYNQKNL
jgi:hypothetical protein